MSETLCSTCTSNGSLGIHNFSVNTIQHALGIKASPFTLSGGPHFSSRATKRQVVTKHLRAYDRQTAGDAPNVEANGFGVRPSTIFRPWQSFQTVGTTVDHPGRGTSRVLTRRDNRISLPEIPAKNRSSLLQKLPETLLVPLVSR